MQLPTIDCKSSTIEELKKAFYTHQPISGIEQRVSHYGPHKDELLPMFLVAETEEGKRLFPGIENTGLGYIGATLLRKHKFFGEEGFFKALKKGYLLLGIGGGPFDEHTNRDEHQSCVNLVVNHLDLFKDPYNRKVYGSLIMYVNFEDQNGDNLIQILNKANPEHRLTTPETESLRLLQTGCSAQNLKRGFEATTNPTEYGQVIAGEFQFFKNHIRQTKLFVKGESEYEKIEKKLTPITVNSQSMNLLEIHSDHPGIHKNVFQKWPATKKEKLGVLFLRKSNGQFVLIPHRNFDPLKMAEVVKIIRQKIAYARNMDPIKFIDLGSEEILDEIPEIHFAKATGVISNGANVDPDVPGLIGKDLSTEDIMDAVIIGLEETIFPRQFSNQCTTGMCARNRCGFYHYGLFRCHKIREKIIA